MSSSNNPAPPEPFILRHTNVSNPSIVVSQKPSQQSLTASEDYYSLSENSSHSTIGPATTGAPIHRYSTPPSRYRTPLQSRELLPQHVSGEELNRTPMRGPGKRRHSSADEPDSESFERPSSADNAHILSAKGVRRKPVPSTVMESPRSHNDAWPLPEERISPTGAQSSVAKDMSRGISPPTPGVDDAPFIRFALEQLTRDEEVRGSRSYPAGLEGPATAERHLAPPQSRYSIYPKPHSSTEVPNASLLWPSPQSPREGIDPPPRHPNRPVSRSAHETGRAFPPELASASQDADVFVPVTPSGVRYTSLDFIPALLRVPALGLFLVAVLAYIACLLFCAVWSLTHTGLWPYVSFGDGRYFIFQYLPSILGVALFCWLLQIQVAVYRITPYIALTSASVNDRLRGLRLPLAPKGFVLPYFGHFRAGQPIAGVFLCTAWLQGFTVPLLASSFNVHFYGQGREGQWRWIATQGAIWVVIGLYALLLVAGCALLVWLQRVYTGLKWDPRSLADAIVLLERSNALGGSRTEEDVAQLGYWRTSARPNEIFHTYGIAEKAPRQYAVEDGRIREKSSMTYPQLSGDADLEKGDSRHSREKMLRPNSNASTVGSPASRSLPWFLRPSAALLWPITAIVLLIAFLVVSYLPSTRVRDGFKPDVPAPVNANGFSATNFLYSFVPSLLAMLCLLVWLNIDYAYRRLQPFSSMNTPSGELAERSLLLSYVADLPIIVTLSAVANRHWRVAASSFVSTFVAPALPMLAGGLFWAQFYVPTQSVRISAHMPAYFALTAFLTVYALSYLLVFPSRSYQTLYTPPSHITGGKLDINSFAALITLFHQTKLLDDVAFHAPSSKMDLVTRLLAAPTGARVSSPDDVQPNAAATASKTSLADSVRGFGKARQKAIAGLGVFTVPRFMLGRYTGRDGRGYIGIDRTRE